MAASINQSTLEAFQSYVETHHTELWGKVLVGFASAPNLNIMEGIKGKHLLPTISAADMTRRWSAAFAPPTDTVTLGQRALDVFAVKAEAQFLPQDLEKTWLGELRRRGQTPAPTCPSSSTS